MFRLTCWTTILVSLAGLSAEASFLGLNPGDVIGEIGFSVPGPNGASFEDNVLTVGGDLLDITTTTGDVLTEIAGGQLNFSVPFQSESITPLEETNRFMFYEATFGSSVNDPTDMLFLSGPEGMPGGQAGVILLESAAFGVTISGVIDMLNRNSTNFQLVGRLDVLDGGTAEFVSLFGNSASFPDHDGTVTAATGQFSDGGLGVLMDESGTLFGSPGTSFDFSMPLGEVTPTNPVPEPATLVLLMTGAFMARARRGRT